MRKNAKDGIAGRRALAAVMAGLMGAAGFPAATMPVAALAETNVPSVGSPATEEYVQLSPAEVDALYADTDSPDLSDYYIKFMPKDGDLVYFPATTDPLPAGGEALSFGYGYGTHADDAALFRKEMRQNTQTGSGTTDLTMILESSGEFGGTDEPIVVPADEPGTGHYDENGDPQDGGDYELNPYYNPDENHDGLGDNLAFTVPSSINYVVKADGTLLGPDAGAAYIENESTFAAHVSSLDVDEQSPFNIVADATVASEANAVSLEIGPQGDVLNAHDYLDKAAVGDGAAWNMAATADGTEDQVPLTTSGNVANVSADISTTTKFGEIHWYVTGTRALPSYIDVNNFDTNYFASIVEDGATTIDGQYIDTLYALVNGQYVPVVLGAPQDGIRPHLSAYRYRECYYNNEVIGTIGYGPDEDTGDSAGVIDGETLFVFLPGYYNG